VWIGYPDLPNRKFDDNAITDTAKYMYDRGDGVVTSSGIPEIVKNTIYDLHTISVIVRSADENYSSEISSGPYIDFADQTSGFQNITLFDFNSEFKQFEVLKK